MSAEKIVHVPKSWRSLKTDNLQFPRWVCRQQESGKTDSKLGCIWVKQQSMAKVETRIQSPESGKVGWYLVGRAIAHAQGCFHVYRCIAGDPLT
jgi:hypothetical protein